MLEKESADQAAKICGLLPRGGARSFGSANIPVKISAENFASRTVKIGLYRDALFCGQ